MWLKREGGEAAGEGCWPCSRGGLAWTGLGALH